MVYGPKGDPSGTWLAIDVQQVMGAITGALRCLRALSIFGTGSGMCAWMLGVCAVALVGSSSGGHPRKVLALLMPRCPRISRLQLIKAQLASMPYQQCAEMRQLREWAMTVPVIFRQEGSGRNADISVAVVTGAGSFRVRLVWLRSYYFNLSTTGWYPGVYLRRPR